MSDIAELPQLKCELKHLPNGIAFDDLSVGSDFQLSCTGLLPEDLKPTLIFKSEDENQNYKLHILSIINKNAGGLELQVTSYIPGEYSDQTLVLSDGQHDFAMSPISWKVKSVMQQSEKPEIRPPEGPFYSTYPIWMWAGFAIFVLVFGLVIYRNIRKRLQKKDLIARALRGDLSEKSASPYLEFNKTYRRVLRNLQHLPPNESFKQIDEAFRMFILRTLLVPAFDWNTNEILKDIRKNQRRVYEECSGQLKRVLSELNNLNRSELKESDVEQVMNLVLKLVENIDRLKPKART